ncbi:hypothetical protein EG329_002240 [Mollisiaceae sp. DMI_Dod_QoI]|nr:hypothetical protein EG329_002240 [Helotiales sp. DMI_Dod_QoI]
MLSDHRKDSTSAEKRPTKPGGSGISNSNRTLDFDPSINKPPPYEMSNNMDGRVDIPTPQSIHSQFLLDQPQRPEDIEVNTTTTGFDFAFTCPNLAFTFTSPTGINLRCSTRGWVLLVIAMLAFIIWMLSKNPSTT